MEPEGGGLKLGLNTMEKMYSTIIEYHDRFGWGRSEAGCCGDGHATTKHSAQSDRSGSHLRVAGAGEFSLISVVL